MFCFINLLKICCNRIPPIRLLSNEVHRLISFPVKMMSFSFEWIFSPLDYRLILPKSFVIILCFYILFNGFWFFNIDEIYKIALISLHIQ
jgi:hypothetical protein